jgi:hypothetical protein
MRYFSTILLLISISCSTTNKVEEERISYVEQKLSFFDPSEQTWLDGKNSGNVYEKWIRQPENIQMLHETFKQVGYRKLITEDERLSTILKYGISIRKPMNELIDSLLLTYELDTINSKYYREFWLRRAKENNQETVYEILSEIASELYEDHIIEPEQSLVNDTLYNLIMIRELEDSITKDHAIRNFNYLKNIGMHKSAYNLLYERYRYHDIEWNREKLASELTEDTVNCCLSAWIEDDTK